MAVNRWSIDSWIKRAKAPFCQFVFLALGRKPWGLALATGQEHREPEPRAVHHHARNIPGRQRSTREWVVISVLQPQVTPRHAIADSAVGSDEWECWRQPE
jgi:hypothetical protein